MTDLEDREIDLESEFVDTPSEEDREGGDPRSSEGSPHDLPPDPSDDDDGLVEIPGHGRFRPEDLAPYARVAQWAQTMSETNPRAWERIVEWERNGYDDAVLAPPAPAAAGDAEDLDLDPDVSRLREEMADLRDRLQTREHRESVQTLQRGAQSFRSAHADVTDDDLTHLWEVIHRRNLLPGFVDDAPDELTGVQDALEAAYRIEYFDRARDTGRRQVVKDIRDRRRAAAVGSSARSAPRVEPEPKTSQDRQQGLLASIREAMES